LRFSSRGASDALDHCIGHNVVADPLRQMR